MSKTKASKLHQFIVGIMYFNKRFRVMPNHGVKQALSLTLLLHWSQLLDRQLLIKSYFP